jgi:hypothetical protein
VPSSVVVYCLVVVAAAAGADCIVDISTRFMME